MGHSSWGHKEPDTTEQLTLHYGTTAVLRTAGNTNKQEHYFSGVAWWATVQGGAELDTT